MHVVLARYCYHKSSVCPSVCLSVCDVEVPRNSGGIRVGSLFSADNLQYLWNWAAYDQGYYWWPIGSRIITCYLCQNQRPWMTLKGHHALCFKTHAFFGVHQKMWTKIDTYYQRRRCSPMTLVSGSISFTRGFPGAGASNGSGVIENVDFQGFRTLRLRHLRK